MIKHVSTCARGRGLPCNCGADGANKPSNLVIVGRALVGRRFTPEEAKEIKDMVDHSTRPLPKSQGLGAKFDSGKPRWSLLMQGCNRAVEGVVKVLTFGAKKYEANSWQTVPSGYERYRDALYRHLNAIERGEFIDPESLLPHWYHVSCNSLFCTELWEKENVRPQD